VRRGQIPSLCGGARGGSLARFFCLDVFFFLKNFLNPPRLPPRTSRLPRLFKSKVNKLKFKLFLGQETFLAVREPGFRTRFLALLKTRPKTNRLVISDATWRRLIKLYGFQAFVALDQDVDHAHEILQSANAVLSSTTAAAIDNTGVTIFPEPLEGYESTSSDFYLGSDGSGQPLIFKIPRPDFAREITICRDLALEENKVPGLLRISVRRVQIRQQTPHEERRTQVEALVMPLTSGSLLKIGKLHSQVILQHSESIIAGLNWLHGRGYVHMDVKGSNIFVTENGNWFLADFGTCVRIGERVQGTTTWCYPKLVNGQPSQFEFDWYMLAVALLAHECLTLDHGRLRAANIQAWEADEVDGDVHIVDDAKIRAVVAAIEHEPLRERLKMLLNCKTATLA